MRRLMLLALAVEFGNESIRALQLQNFWRIRDRRQFVKNNHTW